MQIAAAAKAAADIAAAERLDALRTEGVRVVQGRQARQASCTAWMATAAAVREAPTAGVVVPTSATALTRSAAAVAFAEPAPPAGFVWGAIY